jgi:hypothetical protein
MDNLAYFTEFYNPDKDYHFNPEASATHSLNQVVTSNLDIMTPEFQSILCRHLISIKPCISLL